MIELGIRSTATARIPSISAAQALGAELLIDLRSPLEYSADHVPGARNVPLFGDAERALIGTLYQRSSPSASFEAGRLIASRRIHELVGEISALAGWNLSGAGAAEGVLRMSSAGIEAFQEQLEIVPSSGLPTGATVLYCWRGGLRSRSVAGFLLTLGATNVFVIEGGYRAYRRLVVDRLERWTAPASFVLRGLTGVGKTRVLREIEHLRPGWTLDLEGLAGHRSSILGAVGLAPCSQKAFESRLLKRIASGWSSPLVLEGESRKVGDIVLPRAVWEGLESGASIELHAPADCRVKLLLEEYLSREENRKQLVEKLPFIEDRLGRNRWRGKLVELLEAGREAELVELLLEQYYDPLYRHSERGRFISARIDASDPGRAALEVVNWIEAR